MGLDTFIMQKSHRMSVAASSGAHPLQLGAASVCAGVPAAALVAAAHDERLIQRLAGVLLGVAHMVRHVGQPRPALLPRRPRGTCCLRCPAE